MFAKRYVGSMQVHDWVMILTIETKNQDNDQIDFSVTPFSVTPTQQDYN